jgi:fibronectin-binding autotransporter adhesin
MKNRLHLALILIFSATAWAQAPTVLNATDLLVNSRAVINSNFSSLYSGKGNPIDCSGTTGASVVTVSGSGTASVCHTLTWANILTLAGVPTFVSSFNSRTGAISLQASDVAAVEQDLRNSASPNFNSLTLGGTLAVTGASTFTGTLAAVNNATVGGTLGVTGATTLSGTLAVTGQTQFTTSASPATAGGTVIGTLTLPFSSLYLGNAATNNIQLTGTATGSRVATFPDASLTVSGTKAYDCGTSAACSPTNEISDWEFYGSVALSSASPSQATVTGLSPAFTSTSTYYCVAIPQGATAAIAAAGVAVSNVSGSSFTLTGPNTVTTVMNYRCRGH